MDKLIKNIKGTKDILPDNSKVWQYVEEQIHIFMQKFGYLEIRTPIFESTNLFNRSIGEETDIVSKEMYSWVDQGGNNLTLKPELTAPVIRSFIQHDLGRKNNINKLYYLGSVFRRERPQKGRFRQFEQFGVEAIGSDKPEQDVEIISLIYYFYQHMKIENLKLKINSIGSKETREKYKKSLTNYLNQHKKNLTDTSKKRLINNPLRILDTKVDFEKEIIKNAPKILDFLNESDKKHFDSILLYLDKLNIKYEVDHLLVRGLDYYSRTVFEIHSDLLGSQAALCGGGRYDYLVEELGGEETPAFGFAAGTERLIMSLNLEDHIINNNPDIYLISIGEKAIEHSLLISNKLRLNKNLKVVTESNRRSLKAQMKNANKLNVNHVIIIGDEEINNNKLIIRDMKSGDQTEIDFDKIETYFK